MAGWGIFQETTTLFNRAPIALEVRFDGQTRMLAPGENLGVPKLVVPYAKKQNPRMGSESYYNPTASGYEPLIGDMNNDKDVKRGLCTPLTPEEWADHNLQPMRLNKEEMEDERGIVTVVRGKKMKNPFEARQGVNAGFDSLTGHE